MEGQLYNIFRYCYCFWDIIFHTNLWIYTLYYTHKSYSKFPLFQLKRKCTLIGFRVVYLGRGMSLISSPANGILLNRNVEIFLFQWKRKKKKPIVFLTLFQHKNTTLGFMWPPSNQCTKILIDRSTRYYFSINYRFIQVDVPIIISINPRFLNPSWFEFR